MFLVTLKLIHPSHNISKDRSGREVGLILPIDEQLDLVGPSAQKHAVLRALSSERSDMYFGVASQLVDHDPYSWACDLRKVGGDRHAVAPCAWDLGVPRLSIMPVQELVMEDLVARRLLDINLVGRQHRVPESCLKARGCDDDVADGFADPLGEKQVFLWQLA